MSAPVQEARQPDPTAHSVSGNQDDSDKEQTPPPQQDFGDYNVVPVENPLTAHFKKIDDAAKHKRKKIPDVASQFEKTAGKMSDEAIKAEQKKLQAQKKNAIDLNNKRWRVHKDQRAFYTRK